MRVTCFAVPIRVGHSADPDDAFMVWALAAGRVDTRGLELDMAVITTAITPPFHNGRTEGVNTRIEMIKRQMYGRAGFALLRHRILLS